MSDAPHEQSVTGTPCACGYLQRVASEEGSPIVFDEELQEYQLRWGAEGTGSGPIYHCPFCGGAAPRSRRASLFADVPYEEVRRLADLTRGLKSLEEAVDKLGPAEYDWPDGTVVETPGPEGEPAKGACYRTLRFTHLSEVADVDLVDYGVHGVRMGVSGKYLGERPSGRTRR